jgi:hypothetical protein
VALGDTQGEFPKQVSCSVCYERAHSADFKLSDASILHRFQKPVVNTHVADSANTRKRHGEDSVGAMNNHRLVGPVVEQFTCPCIYHPAI